MNRQRNCGNVRGDYRNRRAPYGHTGPVCRDGLTRVSPGRDYDSCNKDKRNKRIAGFDDNQKEFPVGMCYVPWQTFDNLFDNEFEAIKNATIFKDLDLEWYGRGC